MIDIFYDGEKIGNALNYFDAVKFLIEKYGENEFITKGFFDCENLHTDLIFHIKENDGMIDVLLGTIELVVND